MSTRPSIPVKGIAISAAALGAAIALIVPMSASAAAPVSQGTGRLLTASIAGTPSTPLLNLAGATAVDANGTGTVTSDVPLDATVLDALNLQAGPTDLFGPTGIIQLGAVGQFAQARDDGSSVAFSGTVSSAPSLVGSGTTVTGSNLGTPGAGNSASIGLTTSALSVNVAIGAVAASAQQPVSGAATGEYVLDNVGVVLGGTVLAPVATTVGGALDSALSLVNPLIGTPIANPFTGGTITITPADLLAAAGVPDLNHLAPGTDLMSFLPAAVVAKVSSLATGVLTQLQTAAAGLDPITGALAIAAVGTLAGTLAVTVSSVTTPLTTALGTALSALISIPVNNKTTNPDGSFTQNAITINVLGAAGAPALASVQLANATVGPNAGPTAVTPGGPGTTAGSTPAALLAETGVTIPVGATLAGAGLLAAAGFGLTRLAAWRRRGTHRGLTTTR